MFFSVVHGPQQTLAVLLIDVMKKPLFAVSEGHYDFVEARGLRGFLLAWLRD